MRPVVMLLGSRLLGAGVLLALLTALQLVIPAVLPVIVAIVLIILPIIHWSAVGFFAARSLEDPTIVSLRARVQDAVALALAGTVGAALGLIVVLRAFELIAPVDRGVYLVGLSFSLLMVAAPAVNWLVTWRPWRRETV